MTLNDIIMDKKIVSEKLDTLLPKKLTKEDGNYSAVEELDKVLSVAKKENIRNIALTGSFGSGKSSVLKTLREDFKQCREYLPISLATLQANDKNEKNKSENDEINIENLNRKIEYSILQQLVYRESHKTLYNSRFKRIIHLEKKEVFKYSSLTIVFLICFLILFEPSFAKVETLYNFFNLGYKLNLSFDIFSAGVLLFFAFTIIKRLIKIISNSKLNKLNLKNGEIELVDDNSIFNKHLDEILYFFQATNYNVVIIEDLDRFDTTNIFLKLRELNQIINESKIVDRHITFIYAIKDDMFKDQDRTKFFDYIVTTIPIINPYNSKNILKEKLKGCKIDEIKDDDLSEIAFFIQDMRTLINIVNEYKQYSDKLCNQGANLDMTKLLAMITYKNYYPNDFALLSYREGKVYDFIIKKRGDLITKALENVKSKREYLRKQKEDFSRNQHIQKNELILLFLYEWRNKWYQDNNEYIVTILIDNKPYSLEDISTNDDLFSKILTSNINYQYKNEYGYYTTTKAINNINNFLQTKNAIEKLKALEFNEELHNLELRKIDKEEQEINNLKIKDLLRYFIKDDISSKDLEDMQYIFIKNGYIDEDYYDYISFFYSGMISFNDRNLLINMKKGITQDYNIHIDKIENFEKELTNYTFASDAILNIELLDYLAAEKNSLKEKFLSFMLRLEQKNAPLNFLTQYYVKGKQKDKVFYHYINNNYVNSWEEIYKWKYEYEKEILFKIYFKYCDKVSELAQDWLNLNFEFLATNIDYITSDKAKRLSKKSFFYGKLPPNIPQELLESLIISFNYEINLDNLYIITKHLSNNSSLSENNLNYTRIKETNNEDFIDNINDYLSIVLHNLKDEDKDESSENLIYILKSIIDKDTKIKYLTGQHNQIDNFDHITDDELYNIAIETKIIKPTWSNISTYYNQFRSITDILFDYINHFIEELSEDTDISSLENKDIIYESLLCNNKLSFDNYKKLLHVFTEEFPNINILSTLDKDRLKVLIDAGRIPFNEQALDVINKTELLLDYIKHYPNEFIENLNWKYNFNTQVIYELLKSDIFSLEDKLNIIKITPIDIIKESVSIRSIVIDIFCEKESININIEDSINLLNSYNDQEKKIKLAIIIIKNEKNHSIINKLLNTIGGVYSDICNKGKTTLPINDLNILLLNELKAIKFVSYRKYSKGLRVIKNIHNE